jgi:hypothetical protein
LLYFVAANVEISIPKKRGPPEVYSSFLQCQISMVPSVSPPSPADEQAARFALRQAMVNALAGIF